MNPIRKSVTLPNGKEVHIETGRLAKLADGSVVVRCGDTMLLATVVANKEINTKIDYLPLSVDYFERFSSTGRIPGGFLKRDGRLGEGEILVSRLVDRALRPLFPEDYHADVQVMIQLISSDLEEMGDSLACLAASSALMASDIPFPDPVSEVRVARVNGELLINPLASQIKEADLDLMIAATNDSIVMVEGEMKEVSEETMLEAFRLAHEYCRMLNNLQLEIRTAVGKEIRKYDTFAFDEALFNRMKSTLEPAFEKIVSTPSSKETRSSAFSELMASIKEAVLADTPDETKTDTELRIKWYFKEIQKDAVRKMILDKGMRLDGRGVRDVRQIWCEAGYLPRAHGSAIFTRGETQSLVTTTLGTKLDEQMIDTATVKGEKRFWLQYNFPGFSTGEVRPNRAPGRREVGHGNLAERALKAVMPENFDYTVRVVSDILESNGSSSMASVCGGCLALMDAGVPLKAPVSGIAMGLITDGHRYAVLSDILGDEDHLGDMDFKVAGTSNGLTACQMDIKVRGLSHEILSNALMQAKEGRAHILSKMLEVLAEPRADLSPYAPRYIRLEIPSDYIGAVIGTGGKVIQEIQRNTNTTINIEEEGNKGIVLIYAVDKTGMDQAYAIIKGIVTEPEVGEIYHAKVKSIKDFGAFVEFMPGKEGLLHISEIQHKRLDSMEGVLNVGDEIDIKIIGVDQKTGKYRLSAKALLPLPEGHIETADNGDRREHRGPRNDRGDRKPRHDGPRHRD